MKIEVNPKLEVKENKIMNYSRNCTCCGDYISTEQMNKLIKSKEFDSEGNHCASCYDEGVMNNQLQLMDVMTSVEKSLKPLNRIKFSMRSFEERANTIFRLMDKGLINWQIG